jgi:acetyl-CoA carboxylase biotin carboxyl carrier protein
MARERIERGGDVRPAQSSTLNVAEIRQLVKLMGDGDIDEITIEQEAAGLKLTLRKPAPVIFSSDLETAATWPDDPAPVEKVEEQSTTLTIGAPLVGIFRASMKPDGKPLVAVGDTVREGQVVAAIEALNVLNEVEASYSGSVVEIKVADGQPVEYGQPLLIVEPQAH